jgi:L-fuculokinase
MVAEAEKVGPGSGGVMVVPSFVPSTGPTKKHSTRGTVLGLELATTRGHLYRATLEGLGYQLKQALGILGGATGYDIRALRVVGGGSKNPLWNRLRADITGLPVVTIAQKEATVLGAAIFALVGAGEFASVDEAQDAVRGGEEMIYPGPDASLYEEPYQRYCQVPPALEDYYRSA